MKVRPADVGVVLREVGRHLAAVDAAGEQVDRGEADDQRSAGEGGGREVPDVVAVLIGRGALVVQF